MKAIYVQRTMDFTVSLILCVCLTPTHMIINAESANTEDVSLGIHFKLYKLLDNKANLIFSPNSVLGALHLLYEGSDGSTMQALRKALFPYPILQQSTNVKSSLTSSRADKFYTGPSLLCVSKEFVVNLTYEQTLEDKFAVVYDDDVDFRNPTKGAAKMNKYIAQGTEGGFKDLVKPSDIHAKTEMMLAYIADFYNNYGKRFNPKRTKMQTFYLNDKDTKQVEMMHMDKMNQYILIDDVLDAKILQFKFAFKNFELVIFLPNKRGNIEDMKNKLFAENNVDINELLKATQLRAVNLALPKFVISSTFNLTETLYKLGLEEIFTPEANFVEMTEYGRGFPELYPTEVIHGAFMNVTEFKTMATGATAVTMDRKPKTPQSTEDQPMYFVPLEHFNNPSKRKRSTDEPKMDFMLNGNLSIPSKTERSTEEPILDYIVDHPFVFFACFTKAPEGATYTVFGQVYDP